MNRAVAQLAAELEKRCLERGAAVETFTAELVARWVVLACAQGGEVGDVDRGRLLDVGAAVLAPDGPGGPNVTGRTLRMAEAGAAEFVSYCDGAAEVAGRPGELACVCFQEISGSGVRSADAVYQKIEKYVVDAVRPLSLEQGGAQLGYGLKVALGSILPRADAATFRDMLVQEARAASGAAGAGNSGNSGNSGNLSTFGAGSPGGAGNSSGARQLTELAEVCAGVCLVGDPPFTQLQAAE